MVHLDLHLGALQAVMNDIKRQIPVAKEKLSLLVLTNLEFMHRSDRTNMNHIDRDSLSIVFSFLSPSDWKTRMWRCCNWWYQCAKRYSYQKLTQKTLCDMLSADVRLALNAPTIYPYTHFDMEASEVNFDYIVKNKRMIHSLRLVGYIGIRVEFAPLIELSQLEDIEIDQKATLTLDQLDIIKQLPRLKRFTYHKWTNETFRFVTTQPTHIAKWQELNLEPFTGDMSLVRSELSEFVGLQQLDIGAHALPHDVIKELKSLKVLLIAPRRKKDYDLNGTNISSSLRDAVKSLPTNIVRLLLNLRAFFTGKDTREEMVQLDQQLTDLFKANSHITQLDLHNAHKLADLTCLTSLKGLTSLTLGRCCSLTCESLMQLRPLHQLSH